MNHAKSNATNSAKSNAQNNAQRPNLSNDRVLALDLTDIDHHTVRDSSPNAYQAKVVGEPTLVVDDYFGCCISFNGDGSQYIEINPLSDFPTADFTLACWVKVANTVLSGTLLSFATSASDTAFVLANPANISCLIDGKGTASSVAVNDGQWHHLAVSWDSQNKQRLLYKDGIEVSTEVIALESPLLAEGVFTLAQQKNAAGDITSDQAFDGQMAHINMFGSILESTDIQQLMNGDKTALASFKTEYPLDFNLSDDNARNVLYISDLNTSHIMHLQLDNTSTSTLLIQPPDTQEANDSNHHFALKFKPNTFEVADTSESVDNCSDDGADDNASDNSITKPLISAIDLPSDWLASQAQTSSDGKVTLYLLYTGTEALSVEPGSGLDFSLEYASAAGSDGSRSTNITLFYRQLCYQHNPAMISGVRLQSVDIINQRGKSSLPLLACIVGSNTILNDAGSAQPASGTASHIVIRLLNTLNDNNQLHFTCGAVNDDSNSRFTVTFDDPAGDAWDLAEVNQLKAIQASMIYPGNDSNTALDVSLQGQRPVFSFVAPLGSLQSGEYIDITLANIHTRCASGFANIHIDYENIPGYQDGRFVVQVEKSPIVHATVDGHKHIGMGAAPDGEHRLKVNGDLAVSGKVKEKNGSDGYYDLLPEGAIVMWHSNKGKQTPDGWALCDGGEYQTMAGEQVTTPDLRNRFVVDSGGGQVDESRPPFYALDYMMKL